MVKPCHFSWMVMKPREGSEQQSLVRICMVIEELWGVAVETSKFRKRKINSGATISLHLDVFLDLCVYVCTVLLAIVGQPDLNVTLHGASSDSYHPGTCPLDFHTLHLLCLHKKGHDPLSTKEVYICLQILEEQTSWLGSSFTPTQQHTIYNQIICSINCQETFMKTNAVDKYNFSVSL